MTSTTRQWPRIYPGTPDRILGGKETGMLRGFKLQVAVEPPTLQPPNTVVIGPINFTWRERAVGIYGLVVTDTFGYSESVVIQN